MGFTLPEDRFITVPRLGSNPGAGNPYDLIPPTGHYHRVVAGRFVLTTAVAVANRVVKIDFYDGFINYGGFISNVVQAASLVYEYIFMVGYTGGGHVQSNIVSLPWADNVWIHLWHYLRFSVVNMQAADTLTEFRFTLEQTIDDLA